jgi:hypothetical protein
MPSRGQSQLESDHVNTPADGVRQVLDIAPITAHDRVAAAQCAGDDTGVYNVRFLSAGEQLPGDPGARLVQRLDHATVQEPREEGLRPSAPRLSEDTCGDRWRV